MKFLNKFFIFVLCFLWTTSAWALEIYLKNGDKITGVVISSNSTVLLVQTQAAGEISINKSFINLAKTYPPKQAPQKTSTVPVVPPVHWKKDFSLGYTQQGGNTKSQLGQLTSLIDRKTSENEETFKYNANYSSSDGAMNGKKFYGLLRYAYSFGEDSKWYNSYQVEAQQDYFADIEYRVTPSTGIGYWFSTTPDLKLMTELGLGYQYTDYRVDTMSSGGQPVLVPHAFFDKRLIDNLHLSEDFTFYPSLENFNKYTYRSETDLIHQISKRWSLKLSYIDDFNSYPPPGIKKNDYTFATSLEFHY